jgi:glycine C-acetyltransferase
VPQGQARIRVQISAAHSIENLDYAADQFLQAKKELESG